MTAKIGGRQSPCTKRRTTILWTSGAKTTSKVGTDSANRAAVMSRLRPSTSAIVPVIGAVRATASVPAVMMVLISAGLAPNSRESSGKSACGE